MSNKELTNSVKYQIKYMGDEIMLSNPVVNVTIIPQPNNVSLTCEGKMYNMDRVGTQWTVLLQDITEVVHTIDIKPTGAESTEITIKVVGIGINTDINDMFDL